MGVIILYFVLINQKVIIFSQFCHKEKKDDRHSFALIQWKKDESMKMNNGGNLWWGISQIPLIKFASMNEWIIQVFSLMDISSQPIIQEYKNHNIAFCYRELNPQQWGRQYGKKIRNEGIVI